MTYSFTVVANPPDGTYYPLFSVSSRDAGSIRYPVKVDVDTTDIVADISEKPDNFALSTKSRVNVSIINPRAGAIGNVIITPASDGADVGPATKFVSEIPAGGSVEIPFDVTPQSASNVTFHITYTNGAKNKHSMDVFLPLNIGSDKKGVVPVVNNVAVTPEGGRYKLTGDLNNAGISDAKSLVVSVDAPAKAVDPYPKYAIGSLASDDFASFEVTFTATDPSSVPLLISWKDGDGNSFSTTQVLDLRSLSAAGSFQRSGTGSQQGSGPGGSRGMFGIGGGAGLGAFYPLIIGAIVVIAAIVFYVKRRWLLARIRKQ
jgi:hypothetical protein